MSRRSGSALLKLAAVTLLVVSAAAVSYALPQAGANRPAAVPAHYVITPFGYFDPSCVAHLAKGDVMRKDLKVVEHADGSRESMHSCAYPHFTGDGQMIQGDERAVNPPSIGHAWVEYGGVTTQSAYAFLYSFWTVPKAPTKNDGQTIYLFNGMEDYKDVVTIIQPVLGWNSDYASAWGLASWNCCESGTVYEGSPVHASSGDLVYGYMFDNCPAGTKTCTSWDIITWDLTTGNYSELIDTSNFGQTFNWAFGGVLEVYNIAQCGDYPDGNADTYAGAGPSIHFFDQGLFNDKFVQIAKPAWKITNLGAGLTPQCNYGGKTPEEITLTY